ncbi:hypothetical protein GCM10009815_10250 [Nocardioides marmoribigeumensis]
MTICDEATIGLAWGCWATLIPNSVSMPITRRTLMRPPPPRSCLHPTHRALRKNFCGTRVTIREVPRPIPERDGDRDWEARSPTRGGSERDA